MEQVIEYRDHKIKIVQDNNCDTPNEWGNTDAFLVYDHRDFSVKREGFNARDIFYHTNSERRMSYNGYHVFVVFAYIHSGVSLSLSNETYPFNDRWDVSSTGYVLIERKKGTYTKKDALKVAEGIIQEWNTYLSGEVYCYQIQGKYCDDSCYGYYGKPEESGCIEDAKGMIDYAIKQKEGVQLEIQF